MKHYASFFSGIMMGALVGATLALLFAPTSGEELRFQIQDQSMRVQQDVKHAAAERRTELEEQLAALRAPRKPTGSVELPQ
jgi:gas vesicle protein